MLVKQTFVPTHSRLSMMLSSLTDIAEAKHIVAWTAAIIASAPDCIVMVHPGLSMMAMLDK